MGMFEETLPVGYPRTERFYRSETREIS